MKIKLLLILFSLSIMSCATSRNFGDPTRPVDAQKVKKERNRELNIQYGAPNR